MINCPKCGAGCVEQASRCVSCGASLARTSRIVAAAGRDQGPAAVVTMAGSAAQPRSRPLIWLLAGGAAVLASLIWVGLSRATDMRLAFLVIGIAVAVGATIGYGIDNEREVPDGVIAVVLTLLGLFLTKAVLTSLMIGDMRREIVAEVGAEPAMIARLAAELPADAVDEDAETTAADAVEAEEHGFDPAIWATARGKWQAMGQGERDAARKSAIATAVAEFENIEGAWIGLGAFFGSFTGIGSTIVAIGIAWTLGSGANRGKIA